MRNIFKLFPVFLAICLLLPSCSLRGSTEASKRPLTREEATETTAETEAATVSETTAAPETTSETSPETEAVPDIPTDSERAAEILSGMTAEEKVGQMFFISCPSTDADTAAAYASEHHIGGYVFFAGDFENDTKQSFADKSDKIQAAAKIPMIMAVDEEGGTVTRVSRYPAFRDSAFKSPRDIYSNTADAASDINENGVPDGIDAITADAAEKADLLSSIGINVNLAPVCDISTTPGAFMYERSLGEDAETTSAFAAAVAGTSINYGVGSVLKHFPGYGDNADTHTGSATDAREYETFVSSDFLPFSAGIAAAPCAVMVSHNTVAAFDEAAPASMSAAVHTALRTELGFDGVIMTDDLAMDAITEYTQAAQVQSNAVAAILAGNDVVCTSDYETELGAVIAAVNDGTVSMTAIDAAVTRILLWKIAIGIL